MRTENLTAMLATNLEPVDSRRTTRRYALGITAGALAALILTGGVLHVNPALPHEVSEPAFWVREIYCASLAALAVLAVARLARPGARLGLCRIQAAIAEPLNTIPISVEVARGEITVTVPERQDRERYDVNLIAYLPQAVTNVGRGENSGRTLREFNIVRQFRPLGVWNGRESVYRAPVDSFPGDATRIAVLLQRDQQGPIVGSATAVLR